MCLWEWAELSLESPHTVCLQVAQSEMDFTRILPDRAFLPSCLCISAPCDPNMDDTVANPIQWQMRDKNFEDLT
ncbi:hypothetical protein E2C01_016661 [Portunus trituberculatus]|uniref:Uncharacterized protein n=1 Tax=Portunus trituberculatus TaxID=210409 RepID=A0A5B7DQU0_PORTR|nr:hypothetical protein [Portunus trituberculatus]